MNQNRKEILLTPGPLLHKCVEEREMERRTRFRGSMREIFRGNLSPLSQGEGIAVAGAV
jgi:hypothetical protein